MFNHLILQQNKKVLKNGMGIGDDTRAWLFRERDSERKKMEYGKFKRSDIRSELDPFQCKGLLTREEKLQPLPFFISDISDNGMRLWVSQALQRDDQVKMTLSDPWPLVLKASVRWCRPVAGESGYYVGVRILDKLKKLVALNRHFVESVDELMSA